MPFAAQSRLLPEPYSLPARMTSGTPAVLYSVAASKIDISVPAGRRRVTPPSTPGTMQVLEPGRSRTCPHHHVVVAAAGAELVEVGRGDAPGDHVLPGRTVFLDRTGRRDVVRRDAVAEVGEQRALVISVTVPGSIPMPTK